MTEQEVKQDIRVGYQGESGAFSEMAAYKLLGDDIQLVPFPRFFELFHALDNGNIENAIIPIENSIAGPVLENYDLLRRFRPPILWETELQIVHNLIAAPGVELSHVTRVYSHPMALMQCREFFRKHNHFSEIADYDTAGSVKRIVKEGVVNAAAIASESAAQIYRGKILQRNIGDNQENYTRFFLLGSPLRPTERYRGNKTSIVFGTINEPGALARCMNIFAKQCLNITKIESRPIVGRPWEYLFYVDFLGNPAAPNVLGAFEELKKLTETFDLLGCYWAYDPGPADKK